MERGQIVFTVNAKTNEVDLWTFGGTIRAKGELLVHLVNGDKYTFLPARCVFETREAALKAASK